MSDPQHMYVSPVSILYPTSYRGFLNLGLMPPKRHRRPRPQQVRQRFKIQALQRLDHIEAKALGTLRMVHGAMLWHRNQ